MTSKRRQKKTPATVETELLAVADAIAAAARGRPWSDDETNTAILALRSGRYEKTRKLLDDLAKLPPDKSAPKGYRLEPLFPSSFREMEYDEAHVSGLPYGFRVERGCFEASICYDLFEDDDKIHEAILDDLGQRWNSPAAIKRLKSVADTNGNFSAILERIAARRKAQQQEAKRYRVLHRALQDAIAPALATIETLKRRGFVCWRDEPLDSSIHKLGGFAHFGVPGLEIYAVPKGPKVRSLFPKRANETYWTIVLGEATIVVWREPVPPRDCDKIAYLNTLLLEKLVDANLVAPEAAVRRGAKLLAGIPPSHAKILQRAVNRTAEHIHAIEQAQTSWASAEAAFAPLKQALERLSDFRYRGHPMRFVANAPKMPRLHSVDDWVAGPSKGEIEIGPRGFGLVVTVERDGSITVPPMLKTGEPTPSALIGTWKIADVPKLSRLILAEIAQLPLFEGPKAGTREWFDLQ